MQKFQVADVNTPILGFDFLKIYKFSVHSGLRAGHLPKNQILIFQVFFKDIKSQMPCDHKTKKFFLLSFFSFWDITFQSWMKLPKKHLQNIVFFH